MLIKDEKMQQCMVQLDAAKSCVRVFSALSPPLRWRTNGVRTLRTQDISALVPKCPLDISSPP